MRIRQNPSSLEKDLVVTGPNIHNVLHVAQSRTPRTQREATSSGKNRAVSLQQFAVGHATTYPADTKQVELCPALR